MRIGIDTLFLEGSQHSSLANFVVGFVGAMVEHSNSHRLVLFASKATARLFEHLPTGSIEVVLCPVSNENRVARVVYQQILLPEVVSRQRIDVLCCLADVAPLRARVPIVLKVNSLHHFTAPVAIGALRSSYRRLMIGASARRARLIVANSRPTADDIRVLLGIPDDRIRLIYEAVDDQFAPCADRGRVVEMLERSYGIVGEYLLFVSALYRYKNVDALIRAFAVLVRTGRWNGSLVIVGPDPHRDQSRLIGIARRLRIANRVTFLGEVENTRLRPLYCGASVLVYPSSSETFGKPIVEAMRCGTPIVAADKGSIPDIASGAALLVDPEDVEAMADAIGTLLKDDHLRNALRAIGLKRGQEFSWRNVALGFAKVLEEASR